MRVFNLVSHERGLELAMKHKLYEIVARMVYKAGSAHWQTLYSLVDDSLLSKRRAFQLIYEMDKISIDEAINHSSQAQFVDTHSDLYSGFQMINIFENKYPGALKNFLYYKNKTLYVMFMVRNENFACIKNDENIGGILEHSVATAALKDTCESLSCLG